MMDTKIVNRLRDALSNYKSNRYTEQDFQNTLNSLITFITEVELLHLRDFLLAEEGELERINFMYNKSEMKGEYLRVVDEIEYYIAKNKLVS